MLWRDYRQDSTSLLLFLFSRQLFGKISNKFAKLIRKFVNKKRRPADWRLRVESEGFDSYVVFESESRLWLWRFNVKIVKWSHGSSVKIWIETNVFQEDNFEDVAAFYDFDGFCLLIGMVIILSFSSASLPSKGKQYTKWFCCFVFSYQFGRSEVFDWKDIPNNRNRSWYVSVQE